MTMQNVASTLTPQLLTSMALLLCSLEILSSWFIAAFGLDALQPSEPSSRIPSPPNGSQIVAYTSHETILDPEPTALSQPLHVEPSTIYRRVTMSNSAPSDATALVVNTTNTPSPSSGPPSGSPANSTSNPVSSSFSATSNANGRIPVARFRPLHHTAASDSLDVMATPRSATPSKGVEELMQMVAQLRLQLTTLQQGGRSRSGSVTSLSNIAPVNRPSSSPSPSPPQLTSATPAGLNGVEWPPLTPSPAVPRVSASVSTSNGPLDACIQAPCINRSPDQLHQMQKSDFTSRLVATGSPTVDLDSIEEKSDPSVLLLSRWDLLALIAQQSAQLKEREESQTSLKKANKELSLQVAHLESSLRTLQSILDSKSSRGISSSSRGHTPSMSGGNGMNGGGGSGQNSTPLSPVSPQDKQYANLLSELRNNHTIVQELQAEKLALEQEKDLLAEALTTKQDELTAAATQVDFIKEKLDVIVTAKIHSDNQVQELIRSFQEQEKNGIYLQSLLREKCTAFDELLSQRDESEKKLQDTIEQLKLDLEESRALLNRQEKSPISATSASEAEKQSKQTIEKLQSELQEARALLNNKKNAPEAASETKTKNAGKGGHTSKNPSIDSASSTSSSKEVQQLQQSLKQAQLDLTELTQAHANLQGKYKLTSEGLLDKRLELDACEEQLSTVQKSLDESQRQNDLLSTQLVDAHKALTALQQQQQSSPQPASASTTASNTSDLESQLQEYQDMLKRKDAALEKKQAELDKLRGATGGAKSSAAPSTGGNTEQKLRSLEQQRNELREQVRALEVSVEDLKAENKKLATTATTSASSTSKIPSSSKSSPSPSTSTPDSSKTDSSKLAELQAKLAKKESALQAGHASLVALQARCDQAEKNATAANETIAGLRQELSDVSTSHAAAIQELESANLHLRESLAQSQRLLTEAEIARDDALGSIEALRQELAETRAGRGHADPSTATATTSKDQSDLAQAQSKVDELTKVLFGAQALLRKNESTLSELAAGKKSAEKELAEVKLQLVGAQKQLDESKSHLDAAQKELIEVRTERDSAMAQVDYLKNQCDTGFVEVGVHSRELKNVQAALRKEELSVATLTKDLADARAQKSHELNEVAGMQLASKAALQRVKTDLAEAQEKINELESSLQEKNRQLHARSDEVDHSIEQTRMELAQANEKIQQQHERLQLQSAELDDARTTLADHERVSAAQSVELASLQSTAAEQAKSLQLQTAELAALQAASIEHEQSWRSKLAELEQRVRTSVVLNEQDAHARQSQTDELNDARSKLAAQAAELSSLQSTAAEQEKSLQAQSAELVALQQASSQHEQSWHGKLAALEQRVRSAGDVSEIEKSLRAELDQTKQDLETIQTQFDDAQSKATKLQQELLDAQQRSENAHSKGSDINVEEESQQVQQLQSQLSEARAEISALKSSEAAAATQLVFVQRSLAESVAQGVEFQARLDKACIELLEQEEQLQSANETKAKLETQLQEKSQALELSGIEKDQASVASLTVIDSLTADLAAKQSELSILTEKHATQKASLLLMHEELTQAMDRVAELEATVANQQQEHQVTKNELESKFVEVESRATEQQKELTTLQTTYAETLESFAVTRAELEAKLSESTTSIESLTNELSNARTDQQTAEQLLANTLQRLQDVEGQVRSSKEALETKDKQLDELNAQQELAANETKATLESRTAELEQLMTESVSAAEANQAELAAKVSEIESLQKQLAESQSSLTTAQKSLEEKSQELDTLRLQSLAAVPSEEHKAELAVLQSKLDASEKSTAESVAQVDGLRGEIGQLKATLEAARSDLGKSQSATESAQAELATSKESALAIQTRLDGATTKIAPLESSLATKNAEYDTLQAQSTAQDAEKERLLREELESVKATLTTRTEELEAAKSTLAARSEELENAKSTLATRSEELERVHATLTTRTQELESAQTLASEEKRTQAAQYESLRTSSEQQSRTIEDVQRELDATKLTVQEKDEEFKTTVEAKDHELRAAQEVLQSVRTELAEIKTTSEASGKRIVELTDSLAKTSAELEQAKSASDASHLAEEQIQQHSLAMSKLKEELSAKQFEVTQLQEYSDQIQAALAQASKHSKEMDAQVESLGVALSTRTKELDDARRESDAKFHEAEKLKTELAALKNSSHTLANASNEPVDEHVLSELRSQAIEAQYALSLARAELSAAQTSFQAQLAAMVKEGSLRETEKEYFRSLNAKLQSEIESFQSEKSSFQSQREELEQQLEAVKKVGIETAKQLQAIQAKYEELVQHQRQKVEPSDEKQDATTPIDASADSASAAVLSTPGKNATPARAPPTAVSSSHSSSGSQDLPAGSGIPVASAGPHPSPAVRRLGPPLSHQSGGQRPMGTPAKGPVVVRPIGQGQAGPVRPAGPSSQTPGQSQALPSTPVQQPQQNGPPAAQATPNRQAAPPQQQRPVGTPQSSPAASPMASPAASSSANGPSSDPLQAARAKLNEYVALLRKKDAQLAGLTKQLKEAKQGTPASSASTPVTPSAEEEDLRSTVSSLLSQLSSARSAQAAAEWALKSSPYGMQGELWKFGLSVGSAHHNNHHAGPRIVHPVKVLPPPKQGLLTKLTTPRKGSGSRKNSADLSSLPLLENGDHSPAASSTGEDEATTFDPDASFIALQGFLDQKPSAIDVVLSISAAWQPRYGVLRHDRRELILYTVVDEVDQTLQLLTHIHLDEHTTVSHFQATSTLPLADPPPVNSFEVRSGSFRCQLACHTAAEAAVWVDALLSMVARANVEHHAAATYTPIVKRASVILPSPQATRVAPQTPSSSTVALRPLILDSPNPAEHAEHHPS